VAEGRASQRVWGHGDRTGDEDEEAKTDSGDRCGVRERATCRLFLFSWPFSWLATVVCGPLVACPYRLTTIFSF
jgi:hypothetical protein